MNMGTERPLAYRSNWLGNLGGEPAHVELECYNFMTDGQWSWRAKMYQGGSTPLWYFDWDTYQDNSGDVRVQSNFDTVDEARHHAECWLSLQGFYYEKDL